MADPRMQQRIDACLHCYSAWLSQMHGRPSLALDGWLLM